MLYIHSDNTLGGGGGGGGGAGGGGAGGAGGGCFVIRSLVFKFICITD